MYKLFVVKSKGMANANLNMATPVDTVLSGKNVATKVVEDDYSSFNASDLYKFQSETFIDTNMDGVVLKHRSDFFCREILIAYAKNLVNAVGLATFGQVYVYASFWHNPTAICSNADYEKLVSKFVELFFTHRMPYFSVESAGGGKFYLKYKVSSSFLKNQLWAMSLLLWILRNPAIIEAINQEFDGKLENGSIVSLFNYLQFAFLKNKSWGNSSNSTLALSLFCYNYTKSSYFLCDYANGPVNAAATGVPTNELISYITDVFLKVFPDVKRIPSSVYVENVWEGFITGFNKLLWLFSNVDKKESLSGTDSSPKFTPEFIIYAEDYEDDDEDYDEED